MNSLLPESVSCPNVHSTVRGQACCLVLPVVFSSRTAPCGTCSSKRGFKLCCYKHASRVAVAYPSTHLWLLCSLADIELNLPYCSKAARDANI